MAILQAYIATGSHKAAAHRLGLEHQTVRHRVMRIRRITGKTTMQLVALGVRDGWLTTA